MSRLPRILPLVAWVAVLVAVIVGFAALGRGAMAGPDLVAPGTWAGWASERTATEAAFAVGRLAVQAIACYLLAVTVLAVVAGVWRAGRLLTVVDVVTLPFVRRTVYGLVGVGMAGASVAGVGAGWSAPSSPGGDVRMAVAANAEVGTVLHRLPTETDPAPAAPSPPPVMRLVTDDTLPGGTPVGEVDDAGGGGGGGGGGGDTEGAEPATGQDPAAPAVATWEIRAGDHLWSVAERVLAEARGGEATDAEIAAYLDELVAANVDRLADPANPDLVFPGQRMVLPTPGGGG